MPKTTTLKFSPSEYKTKAEAVLDLLRRGLSVKEIRNRMAVSESYIYLAKKKLLEAADEAVEAVRHTAAEHNNKIKDMIGGWRAEVEDEAIIEAAAALKEACTFTPKKEGVGVILDARGNNYGAFLDNARITQRLKAVAHQFAGQNNKTFDADQAEALDMIFTKIGRILNGDPNHIDSWIDIAGYATLVADRLQGKAR
jgi:transposase-like protein